jgi:hypothetical protein
MCARIGKRGAETCDDAACKEDVDCGPNRMGVGVGGVDARNFAQRMRRRLPRLCLLRLTICPVTTASEERN